MLEGELRVLLDQAAGGDKVPTDGVGVAGV
jgi:hypothetical protein